MENECFYYLLDEEKYYVGEGRASYNIEDAKKFESIKDVIKTTPIFKDWNLDYKLYKKDGDSIIYPQPTAKYTKRHLGKSNVNSLIAWTRFKLEINKKRI